MSFFFKLTGLNLRRFNNWLIYLLFIVIFFVNIYYFKKNDDLKNVNKYFSFFFKLNKTFFLYLTRIFFFFLNNLSKSERRKCSLVFIDLHINELVELKRRYKKTVDEKMESSGWQQIEQHKCKMS